MNIIELAKQAEEHANNIVRNIDNCESWGFLRDQKFAELVAAAARADDVDDPPLQHVVAAIRARGTT